MWILSKCESDFMNKGIVQMKNFDLEPTYENIKKTLKDVSTPVKCKKYCDLKSIFTYSILRLV